MTGPETFQKHGVNKGELEIYKVLSLPELQAYNEQFSRLVLPTMLGQSQRDRTLTLPYYEGQAFNDAWDIEDGGSMMDLELAYIMPELIEDLSHIDTSLITRDERLSRFPNLTFDHKSAQEYFSGIVAGFADEGILSPSQLARAEVLLAHEQKTELIFSNGDFYPRNLILQADGKVVLIDWEVWNDHSPFFVVDHPENVAAVQYVHMWGNPQWQKVYREELDKRFSFSSESFDKGILMKALTLVFFFRRHQALFDGQVTILRQILGI